MSTSNSCKTIDYRSYTLLDIAPGHIDRQFVTCSAFTFLHFEIPKQHYRSKTIGHIL